MMTRPILLPLPNPPSDAELVTRAIEGDRFGRELIYRRHAAYLLAMVTRLVASRGGAEEIVRQTFASGLRRLSTIPDPEQLRGWLTRIAVVLARRRLRRARLVRLLFLFVGLDRGNHTDAPLAALAAADLRPEALDDLSHVDRVLARARIESRLAWMLRRVEGLAPAEVAAACGCSLATAQRHIAEIDARLVERLGIPSESP
jgi:RNA polymerase sigma-70 factor (ECF subfamily)